MASKATNIFTRIKENVMGTPEQNAQAEKDIAKYKASKAKEKAAEEAKKKTEMAKGGVVKKFKPCATCPSPAKCKAAGKCLAKKMAKGGKVGKSPVVAIMIGVPKAGTKAKKK